MKKTLTLLSIILLFSTVYAQEEKEFEPSGKTFVQVYTNYHSIFVDGEEPHHAFQIQKAYFGYKFHVSEKVSGRITFDVANPGVGKLKNTAFVKHAYFQYKNKRLTTKFGLIGRNQFKIQEKMWGKRYFFKSFQDEHKFGASADLGVFTSYKLHKTFSIDFAIENGEGYKSLETDSILKYSTGFVFSPVKWIETRGYYDFMGTDIDQAQQTFSSYIGFKFDKIKIGTEYNYQLNHKIKENYDFGGYSFYASYEIKKIRLFARLDELKSIKIEGEDEVWNFAKDGQKILAGIEFLPVKGLKIAPHYQAWIPKNGNPIEHIAYLSCEIKF